MTYATRIGKIYNYYGNLFVIERGDKYYLALEDHDCTIQDLLRMDDEELQEVDNVEECDKELHDALVAYSKRNTKI